MNHSTHSKIQTWDRKRLRYLLANKRTIQEENQYNNAQNVSFIPMKAVGKYGKINLNHVKPHEEVKNSYTLFFENDVLVAKGTPYFENGKGAIIKGLVNGIGYGSAEFHVLKANEEILPKFLFYVTISEHFRSYGESLMKGATGQQRVPIEFIKNFELLLPPLKLQGLIVDYLDSETVSIDALIAKKETMLQLLNEKRYVLISEAIIRGLNPNTKMKPSGLNWLGEIPEHWKIQRLKFLTSHPIAYGVNESTLEDNPNWPRFIRITDINENGTLKDDTFRSLDPEIASPYMLDSGDVLFARSGVMVGKSFIYRSEWGKACFSGYLIRFRASPELVLFDFIHYFTLSSLYWQQINTSIIQTTIKTFSAEKYGNLLIGLPPLSEQKEIIQFLFKTLGRFQAISEQVQESLKLLKERRIALITAAVTGQIPIEE